MYVYIYYVDFKSYLNDYLQYMNDAVIFVGDSHGLALNIL